MVKKRLSILLLGVLLLTLVACSKDTGSDANSDAKQKEPLIKTTTPSSTVVTTTTTSAFPIYYVTADPLNVRSGPKASSTKLGELAYGTPVEILGTENGWYRISYEGVRAYISAQYVSPEMPAEATP